MLTPGTGGTGASSMHAHSGTAFTSTMTQGTLHIDGLVRSKMEAQLIALPPQKGRKLATFYENPTVVWAVAAASSHQRI